MAQIIRSILVVMCVAACTTAAKPPELGSGDIRKQWLASIKGLGLSHGIYPPNEDVQLGDVYVFHRDNVRRVDHVDLRPELAALYKKRTSLPKTAAAAGGDAVRPQSTDPKLFGQDGEPDRASLIALPAYTLATVSVREAGLALPLGTVAVGASASERATATVSVRASALETYSILDFAGLGALKDYCRGLRKGVSTMSRPCDASTVAELLLALSDDYSCEDTGVVMVTRLVLARQIDYVVERQDGTAFGAGVAVELAKAQALQAEMKGLLSGQEQSAGTPAQPAAASGKPAENAAMVDRLQSLNAELARSITALQNQLVPGGRLVISDTNGAQIQLSQVFERPLVIAYDGPAFSTDDPAACKARQPARQW